MPDICRSTAKNSHGLVPLCQMKYSDISSMYVAQPLTVKEALRVVKNLNEIGCSLMRENVLNHDWVLCLLN